jgi:hypothetical protein
MASGATERDNIGANSVSGRTTSMTESVGDVRKNNTRNSNLLTDLNPRLCTQFTDHAA